MLENEVLFTRLVEAIYSFHCFCFRYKFERDGKKCVLYIKNCRPDDECEYACGVEDRRTRARLFVEGKKSPF